MCMAASSCRSALRPHAAGSAPAPRPRRLADRELHRVDLLHLVDDDLLGDAPQLFVLAVAQFDDGHVDRALMMRGHHGDEVAVDIAGGLAAMPFIILVIAALVLPEEWVSSVARDRGRLGSRGEPPAQADVPKPQTRSEGARQGTREGARRQARTPEACPTALLCRREK